MKQITYTLRRTAWPLAAALAIVLLAVVLAGCLPFGAGGPDAEVTAIPTWNLETGTAPATPTPTLAGATTTADVTTEATATTELTATTEATATAEPATATATIQPTATETAGNDPDPDLPVVVNDGSPPDGACFVAHPGSTTTINVRSGPGLQYPRVAYLGNWTEVSNSEDGWHQIAIGDGDFGWVSGDVVGLSGPCEAAPERIQFDPGETSTTIEGQLDQPYRHYYVFRAMAGQRLSIVIHSDTGQANFGVSGLEDGQPYKRVENESRDWWIILPETQDYRLTIAAAGPVHYQLNLEIVDGTTAPEPTRLEFGGGTTAMAWGRVEPNEQDLYVFGAQAGQAGVVDLNSTSDPLYAIVGVDTGEVLRPMSADRLWEGTFPVTQDYLVRVVGGDEAANYELIVGIEPLDVVAPIYDHFTGYLMGGVQYRDWVDVGTTVSAMSGGETYRIYTASALAGEATGSAPEKRGGVCPGTILSLSPAPAIEMSLGVGGGWNAVPRTPSIIDVTAAHRDAVASLLAQEGVEVDPIEVNVAQVWSVDLDNDGHAETIIQAARLKDGGATPAVDAGDYAVIAMMKETENGLRTVPVTINAFPEARELAYPWRYYVPNMLDLNDDGRMELVISGARFEGTQTTVYEVDGDGTVRPVMSAGCAL